MIDAEKDASAIDYSVHASCSAAHTATKQPDGDPTDLHLLTEAAPEIAHLLGLAET